MAKKDFTFQIYRQDGFTLNPNDKVVNGVIKGIKRCNGQCPCYHVQEGEETIPEEDLICPCKEYRENKHCRCNLYVIKEAEDTTSAEAIESLKKELQEVKAHRDLLGKSYEEVCNKLYKLQKESKTEKLVY